MAVGFNDVNILTVETNDTDFAAGTDITYEVRAEVGAALFGTFAPYKVKLTVTNTTTPALVDSQEIAANYGGAEWPAAGLNIFTFTVPGALTSGLDEEILEPQARLVSNGIAPFDASHVVGDRVLITP